jgi:hypothetical protein
MYSRYYYYASCDPAVDAYLATGGSKGLASASSSVTVIDRGIVRWSRVSGRGIDHVNDGDDVVEARIGNVSSGGPRRIAMDKEATLDMAVVLEVGGGTAVAAVLGEGSKAVEAVQVFADCCLEEDILGEEVVEVVVD